MLMIFITDIALYFLYHVVSFMDLYRGCIYITGQLVHYLRGDRERGERSVSYQENSSNVYHRETHKRM